MLSREYEGIVRRILEGALSYWDEIAEVLRYAERKGADTVSATMERSEGRLVGEWFLRMREERKQTEDGWSLEAVAPRIGMSISKLRSIEKERVSLPSKGGLEKLEQLYGVTRQDTLEVAGLLPQKQESKR